MLEDSFIVFRTVLSEEMRPAEAGSRRFDTCKGYKPSRTVCMGVLLRRPRFYQSCSAIEEEEELYGNPANTGFVYDRTQMPVATVLIMRPLAVYRIDQCFVSSLVPRTMLTVVFKVEIFTDTKLD